MIARKVGVRVKNQNIYNTEQGVYEATAAVTDTGELVVNFKPRTATNIKEEADFIQVRYSPQETNMIKAVLKCQ